MTYVKQEATNIGLPVAVNLDDDQDIHLDFRLKDLEMTSGDLHLAGALFLSIMSAVSGWTMKNAKVSDACIY